MVAMLAACAVTPPRTGAVIAPIADAPFTVQGRLSARHANDAVSATFVWTHTPPADDLRFASPVGQTVAELSGDTRAGFASVRLADGQEMQAPDWGALTERALGFPLPVAGLSAWIRGAPHAGSAFSTETDPQGRLALLRQDGWEIVFDYPDGNGRRPSRLRLTYPDVEVRLVIDRWE